MSAKTRSFSGFAFFFIVLSVIPSMDTSFAYEIKLKIPDEIKIPLLGKGDKEKKTEPSAETGQAQAADSKNQSAAPGSGRIFGQGVTGPDVMGLRIGMSPSDISSIIKANDFRPSGSDTGAHFRNLTFSGLNGITKEVPNGRYITEFHFAKNDASDEDGVETIQVRFTATPERERAQSLTWIARLPNRAMPSTQAFESSVLKKYGAPTYRNADKYRAEYVWIIDGSGTALKPGSFSKKPSCKRSHDIWALGGEYDYYVKDVANCGSLYFEIVAEYTSDMLVQKYTNDLISYDEMIGSASAVRTMLAGLADTDRNQGVSKADKMNPNLGASATSNTAPQAAAGRGRVSGKGISGPEVLGLRIGMGPADVRRVYTERGFKFKEGLDSYDTHELGRTDTGQPISLKYIYHLHGVFDGGAGSAFQIVRVVFTPTPGRERIMGIKRETRNPVNKYPTLAAFEKSLIEKYGIPSYKDSMNETPKKYRWVFDREGKLQSPSDFFDWSDFDVCAGPPFDSRLSLHDSNMSEIQEISDRAMSTKCGSIALDIKAGFLDSAYNGPETLIDEYSMELSGYDEYIGSAIATKLELAALLENQRKKAVSKGQVIKPDF